MRLRLLPVDKTVFVVQALAGSQYLHTTWTGELPVLEDMKQMTWVDYLATSRPQAC